MYFVSIVGFIKLNLNSTGQIGKPNPCITVRTECLLARLPMATVEQSHTHFST
jgi:hypothetical protein